MAITRTAKGTKKDKTGSTTLFINNVTIEADATLVVGVGFDQGGPPALVTFEGRKLRRAGTLNGNGAAGRIYYARRSKARTGQLLVTFDDVSPPTAKAMWASTYSEVGEKDVLAEQAQAATAAPNSGSGVNTTIAKEALIGLLVAEGPDADADATANNGWSVGQVVGTVGAPPVSNIKVTELFKIVTAIESAQASADLTTARDCATLMATFRRMPHEKAVVLWVERAKCSGTCGDVMWTEPKSPNVVCSCAESAILDHILEGSAVAVASDAEFRTLAAAHRSLEHATDLLVEKA